VTNPSLPPDPNLDLVLKRVIDVPPKLVWRAWTDPEEMKKWFTPAPWSTVRCEIDLRPGGIFRAIMRSPEGQDIDAGAGCVLEVVEQRKLVWTSALQPGYRPAAASDDHGDFPFTAVVTMEPHGANGTKYVATAIHRDEKGRKQHEDMGFHDGWGAALDQLVALAKTWQ